MTEPSSQLDVDHCTAKPMPSGKSPPPASADAKGAIEPGCADVTARPRARPARCPQTFPAVFRFYPARRLLHRCAPRSTLAPYIGVRAGQSACRPGNCESPRRVDNLIITQDHACVEHGERAIRLFLGSSLAVPWLFLGNVACIARTTACTGRRAICRNRRSPSPRAGRGVHGARPSRQPTGRPRSPGIYRRDPWPSVRRPDESG